MRSSRRNRGLRPEYTPEPTPPRSNESNFSQDFQIETTLEEEERIRREEENERSQSNDDDESNENINVTSSKDNQADINLSSDDSTKSDSSDESVAVINDSKETKKSSKYE